MLADASRLREQMGDERFFAALASNGAGDYVSLDRGLAVLSRPAQRLG